MEYLAGLHPKLVHFPIALLFCYTLFECGGFLLGKEWLSKSAFALLIIAVLFMLAALVSGNQAAIYAGKTIAGGKSVLNGPANGLLENHQTWATVTVWHFTLMLAAKVYFFITIKIKKRYARMERTVSSIICVMAMLGCFFLFQAGSYGGRLVYHYGIGTELLKTK